MKHVDLLPKEARRCDSLMKLSNLRILPMAALDQPSSLIKVSTSSRSGATYSGWVAKSNTAWVNAYRVFRNNQISKRSVSYLRAGVDGSKVDREHTKCHVFRSLVMRFSLVQEPAYEVILRANQSVRGSWENNLTINYRSVWPIVSVKLFLFQLMTHQWPDVTNCTLDVLVYVWDKATDNWLKNCWAKIY